MDEETVKTEEESTREDARRESRDGSDIRDESNTPHTSQSTPSSLSTPLNLTRANTPTVERRLEDIVSESGVEEEGEEEKDEEKILSKRKHLTSFDTVVLSGGSSKGILILGALQYARDNYLTRGVKTYIGTSVGSIICYLLSIGYTPVEVIVYICTNNLLEKLGNFNIVAAMNGCGATSFSPIQEQLEKMTISKIGFLPTLGDIYRRFGKILVCVTFNFTDRKAEYLSYETRPDLPALAALRMSANLPMVFDRYFYDGKEYIDGAFTNNFAVDIGDNMGERILGLLISSKYVTGDDEEGSKSENKQESLYTADYGVLDRIYKLMLIPVSQSVEYKISRVPQTKCEIIRLKCDKIKFFDFNFSSKTKLELFSSGYQQMKNVYEG